MDITPTQLHSYEAFKPSFEWVREEEFDTLIVNLAGFKEHNRFEIDQQRNLLKINGERQIDDNRWIHFHKDFQIPENCNVSEIRSEIENGLLYVVLPKLMQEQTKQDQEHLASQKADHKEGASKVKREEGRMGVMKPNMSSQQMINVVVAIMVLLVAIMVLMGLGKSRK